MALAFSKPRLHSAAVPSRLNTLRLYYVACFATLGVYVPYFPRWLEARNIQGLAMGAIAATLPAMGVVGPPLFGLIADGLALRGALLRFASAGALLAFSLITLAHALGHSLGFGVLFSAVLVFALFRAPMVMMADVLTMEQSAAEGKSYAGVRLWGSLGFLVVALLAGRLLDVRDAIALPAAITVTILCALLIAWRLPAKSPTPAVPSPAHARALLASPDIRLFLLAALFAQGGHVSYDLCFSLHLRDLGASELTGVAWALGVVAEVVLMALSTRLFERASPERLLSIAYLGATTRWALYSFVRSVPLLLALQPLHALSFALMWIASLAHIKRRAPAAALATAQGLFSAAMYAGGVLGMLTWGALYRRVGGGPTFAIASLCAGVAFALSILWNRCLRPGRRGDSAEGRERGILRNSIA